MQNPYKCYNIPNVRLKGKIKIDKGSSIAQNCTITGESAGVFIGGKCYDCPKRCHSCV